MKKLPFHPFLFAVYPALALLAGNISQVLLGDARRSFVVLILLGGGIFCALALVLRNWHRAGLIASLALLLFFSYGHLFKVMQGISIGPLVIGRTAVLLPLFMLIFAVWSMWVLMKLSTPENITPAFNYIGIFLVVFPLYTVIFYLVQAQMIRASHKAEIPTEVAERFNGQPPTVYYIILDMHARADVLNAIYDYDESAFINELKEMGFYVAQESVSNYSSTLQSLSSSLNMNYINDLKDTYGVDSNNREPLALLIAQNKVMQMFQGRGYKIGAFQTDDFATEFRDADIYIKPSRDQMAQYQDAWSLNSFEGIFLQTTMARVLYDLRLIETKAHTRTIETPYQLHRLTILNAVDHLPDFARERDPYFIFLHIVAPHPPYIFDANGGDFLTINPSPFRVRVAKMAGRSTSSYIQIRSTTSIRSFWMRSGRSWLLQRRRQSSSFKAIMDPSVITERMRSTTAT